MTNDRYTTAVLTVIAVALTALAAHAWLDRIALPRAEAQTAAPKYDVAVPKAWGKIIGFSNQNLLLEASDGTLRVIDLEGRAPEYPKVKVQAKFN